MIRVQHLLILIIICQIICLKQFEYEEGDSVAVLVEMLGSAGKVNCLCSDTYQLDIKFKVNEPSATYCQIEFTDQMLDVFESCRRDSLWQRVTIGGQVRPVSIAWMKNDTWVGSHKRFDIHYLDKSVTSFNVTDVQLVWPQDGVSFSYEVNWAEEKVLDNIENTKWPLIICTVLVCLAIITKMKNYAFRKFFLKQVKEINLI